MIWQDAPGLAESEIVADRPSYARFPSVELTGFGGIAYPAVTDSFTPHSLLTLSASDESKRLRWDETRMVVVVMMFGSDCRGS